MIYRQNAGIDLFFPMGIFDGIQIIFHKFLATAENDQYNFFL